MKNRRLRVLYLSNAFPPGMTGEKFVHAHSILVPHLSETLLIQELSKLADVSSASLLPGTAWHRTREPKDDSPGLAHDVLLWDRNPALWHRWISWRKLRTYYLDKVQRGQAPDILLVRNLQHVFNHFVKWVRRQKQRPIIVLLLGDSGGLGEKVSSWRRFRYKFKPMHMLEEEGVLLYDACLVSGLKAKRFFEPRGIPWAWIPSGFHFKYNPPPPDPNREGPIRFGYFGTLTERSGVRSLINAFVEAGLPGTLHACGHGELSEELKGLSKRYPNFHFDGFLPQQSDCLPWAQQVDVLVNLRLPYWGQENSAPSKVFEYGMAGKAIISTRTSGMDEVLGDEGLYIETENFEESLRQRLKEASAMSRPELERRGRIIHERVVKDYSWGALAHRAAEFFDKLVDDKASSHGAGAKNGGQI
jgi:glycosyltransferase involved in cell wall biosynthesis